MRALARSSALLLIFGVACAPPRAAEPLQDGCGLNPSGPPTGPKIVSYDAASSEATTSVVQDNASEVPIPGASVIVITKPLIGAVTDGSGHFKLAAVRPGRYRVVVRRVGYLETRDSVTFPVNGALRLEARLRMMPSDGCGGFGEVYFGKPWWKFW
jgi:hypothetical protein